MTYFTRYCHFGQRHDYRTVVFNLPHTVSSASPTWPSFRNPGFSIIHFRGPFPAHTHPLFYFLFLFFSPFFFGLQGDPFVGRSVW